MELLPSDIECIIARYSHEVNFIDIMKDISSGKPSFIPSHSPLSDAIINTSSLAPIDVPFDGWEYTFEADDYETVHSYSISGTYFTFNISTIYCNRLPDSFYDPDDIEYEQFYHKDTLAISEVLIVDDVVFRSFRYLNGQSHIRRLS